jgi:hypothetical protein
MYAWMSSSAFAFVVLSRFDRFLKYTTTFGSEIADRSGGSETYDNCDDATPNAAADEDPKAEEPNVEAARALLALFAPFLLIVGFLYAFAGYVYGVCKASLGCSNPDYAGISESDEKGDSKNGVCTSRKWCARKHQVCGSTRTITDDADRKRRRRIPASRNL